MMRRTQERELKLGRADIHDKSFREIFIVNWMYKSREKEIINDS